MRIPANVKWKCIWCWIKANLTEASDVFIARKVTAFYCQLHAKLVFLYVFRSKTYEQNILCLASNSFHLLYYRLRFLIVFTHSFSSLMIAWEKVVFQKQAFNLISFRQKLPRPVTVLLSSYFAMPCSCVRFCLQCSQTD